MNMTCPCCNKDLLLRMNDAGELYLIKDTVPNADMFNKDMQPEYLCRCAGTCEKCRNNVQTLQNDKIRFTFGSRFGAISHEQEGKKKRMAETLKSPLLADLLEQLTPFYDTHAITRIDITQPSLDDNIKITAYLVPK